ncbi:unnamed protein product, partial [Closterium sp. NIES-65]
MFSRVSLKRDSFRLFQVQPYIGDNSNRSLPFTLLHHPPSPPRPPVPPLRSLHGLKPSAPQAAAFSALVLLAVLCWAFISAMQSPDNSLPLHLRTQRLDAAALAVLSIQQPLPPSPFSLPLLISQPRPSTRRPLDPPSSRILPLCAQSVRCPNRDPFPPLLIRPSIPGPQCAFISSLSPFPSFSPSPPVFPTFPPFPPISLLLPSRIQQRLQYAAVAQAMALTSALNAVTRSNVSTGGTQSSRNNLTSILAHAQEALLVTSFPFIRPDPSLHIATFVAPDSSLTGYLRPSLDGLLSRLPSPPHRTIPSFIDRKGRETLLVVSASSASATSVGASLAAVSLADVAAAWAGISINSGSRPASPEETQKLPSRLLLVSATGGLLLSSSGAAGGPLAPNDVIVTSAMSALGLGKPAESAVPVVEAAPVNTSAAAFSSSTTCPGALSLRPASPSILFRMHLLSLATPLSTPLHLNCRVHLASLSPSPPPLASPALPLQIIV